jgi:hypothetical protein
MLFSEGKKAVMSASMKNIKLAVSSDDIFSIQPFPHPEPLTEIPGKISAIKPLNIPIAIEIKTNNIFIVPPAPTNKINIFIYSLIAFNLMGFILRLLFY